MSTRLPPLLASAWLLAGSAACAGASSDPGLGAWLRVDPAQFVPGPMPEPDGGPEILSARVPHNTLQVGSVHDHVTGSAEVSATAIAIARVPDSGYWIVTTGIPTTEEPDVPSYYATLGLARDFPLGPFELALSAVDRAGHFGPRTTLQLEAATLVDDAELAVELRWDNLADLDLHVQDPQGTDVWSSNINSWVRPGPGSARADAGAWQAGGQLDFDSNASCSGDGLDSERVRWPSAPPAGEYQVRVVTASLCGRAAAHWTVTVRLRGQQLMAASGISLPADTRQGTGARKGTLALTFVVP